MCAHERLAGLETANFSHFRRVQPERSWVNDFGGKPIRGSLGYSVAQAQALFAFMGSRALDGEKHDKIDVLVFAARLIEATQSLM